MHLTLKNEATKPASENFLQQQARFDTFIDYYNQERPHQALDLKVPADLYKKSPRHYRGLGDLEYIRLQDDHIAIGALTTYSALQESRLLQTHCPLLPQVAAVVGDVQVRNRGTIGGGLAHADPAQDLPAAMLALDAELQAVSRRGERWIHAEAFFLSMLTTALAADEILTEIQVPVLKATKTAHCKAAPRAAGFAIVGVAVCMKQAQDGTCEDLAIGITGVADTAYRARRVESTLRGQPLHPQRIESAAAEVATGLEVLEDVNASPAYRAHLAQVYVARTIQAAVEAATTH